MQVERVLRFHSPQAGRQRQPNYMMNKANLVEVSIPFNGKAQVDTGKSYPRDNRLVVSIPFKRETGFQAIGRCIVVGDHLSFHSL